MALWIRARYPEPLMVFVTGLEESPSGSAVEEAAGQRVFPANDSDFTLEELYHYVGQPIDITRLPDGRYIVFNDNGKLDHLPVNVEATIVYRKLWQGHSEWAASDTLVGDVLICEATEVK